MPDIKSKSAKHVIAKSHLITQQSSNPLIDYFISLRPISTIHFDQEAWVRKINKMPIHKSTTLFPIETLPTDGVCAGLTEMWYKFLREGKCLIDVLTGDQPVDVHLIRNIRIAQQKRSQIIIKKPQSYSKNQLLSDVKLIEKLRNNDFNSGRVGDSIRQIMAILDFEEAHENCFHNSDDFKHYFDVLNKNHQYNYGFHTIGCINWSETSSHVFAWTRVADGFLLFDPNTGESYFNSYDSLRDYICYRHIWNVYKCREISLHVCDFYDAEEIKEIQLLQSLELTKLWSNVHTEVDRINLKR